jgi:hypothetical protein
MPRHSGAGRNPENYSTLSTWIPAFAGMTKILKRALSKRHSGHSLIVVAQASHLRYFYE